MENRRHARLVARLINRINSRVTAFETKLTDADASGVQSHRYRAGLWVTAECFPTPHG